MWQESAHEPAPPEPTPRPAREQPERPGPPPGPPGTPFKFLDYFEETEHDSFAGREEEVQEALVGLTRGRTYVLYGRSGLGKTSLLLAGLFPRLRQRGFHPMRVRLLESPVADFCAELATELGRPELAREMGDAERLELVPRVLAEHSTREPLVITLDQFEEFFVRFKERPQEQARFTALLGRIGSERAANVRLVFSMREDYYAQLADLRAALPDLTDNGLRLMPLTAYGTRQAIVRPLQHAGITYEEAFVSRLVDLLAPWLFEPPVLQIVCSEIYQDVVARRGFPVHLTREDLDRLGGVEGVFGGYVHRVTSGLAAERLLLVRVVLDALIAPETRTRRAVRAEDLLAVPVRAELRELREVLGHLTTLRLVRVEDRQGERWYELLHERLVPIIEGWLLTDVDYVRFRQARKFVASLTQDTQWRADPGWLLSAAQLAEGVEPWKERLRLEAQQAEFLLRSGIHARAGSLGYWAERFDEFGAGRSIALLLELSEHPNPETQLAAVAACGQVRDETGRLADRCLRLALSDSNEALRRAAGSSLARLAGPRELERLRQSLELSKPLLEVLADLWEAGNQLPGFPLHWRLRARALVDERRVERHQRSIRHLVGAGVRTALIATPIWCLTVGVLQFIYRASTLAPPWVSHISPDSFLIALVAVVVSVGLFLLFPAAGLVAWRVTRRACIEVVLHGGGRRWSRSVLRSPALILCSALLSPIGGFVALNWWQGGISSLEAPQLLLVILGPALLTWLMTTGLIWLGSRCIPPNASVPKVYLWALLSSTFLPTAVEQAVGLAVLSGWLGPHARPWMSMMGVTSIISSFLSMSLICALNQSLDRPRGLAPVLRRESMVSARALVALTAVAFFVGFYFFVGTDTIPFLRERQLKGELSLSGSVWNVRDADYFPILAPHEGLFAVSVKGESSTGTELVINGDKLTSGSLLISALPDLTAAVIARPPPPKPEDRGAASARSEYQYVLREEPILQQLPVALSTDHWALVTLRPITIGRKEGQPSLWQVVLKGQVPPEKLKEITGVQVRPVMLQFAELPSRHCMAILGSPFDSGADIRTFITRNQAATEIVPPPDSRAELLLEDFRVEFEDEGRWGLMMTLIPFQEFTPPQCQEPRGPLALLSRPSRPAASVKGQEPTLTVAIKLY